MTGLPDGFRVVLAPQVRIRDAGRTLVGGTPPRVTRLSVAGSRLLSDSSLTVVDDATRALAERLLGSGVALPDLDSIEPLPLHDVTCVVPVRDRPASLDRLLRALDGRVRVLIVDDGSTDPAATARVAAAHRCLLVRLDVSVGPAAARNLGARTASGRYVVFVDSDVVVTPEALTALVTHFRDPAVAAVAPRIRALVEGSSPVERYESARSALDLGPRSTLVRARTRVSYVPSAVLAVRRDALGSGFDEAMASGEDVDLVWRLLADGWRVRYDAEIVARHDHLVEPAAWLRRKAFYGASAADLARRHGDLTAPAVFTPAGAATALAVLAQRRWSLPAALALTAWSGRRLAQSVRDTDRPVALSADLAVRGLAANLEQVGALLLRHWWPATAVLSLVSRRCGRAVLVAALADGVISRRRSGTRLDLGRWVLLRRLDDASYGVGVWAGAVRARSTTCLRPALLRRSR